MCDWLELQLQVASDVKSSVSQPKDHLRKAETFYSNLRMDTTLAKENAHIATLTFENLPLPSIPVGEVFYMHQLWMYVFGIHSYGTNLCSHV